MCCLVEQFLNLGIIGILGQKVLCFGSCPVHFKMFHSSSGFCLLKTSRNLPCLTTKYVSRCFWMCLGGKITRGWDPLLQSNWNHITGIVKILALLRYNHVDEFLPCLYTNPRKKTPKNKKLIHTFASFPKFLIRLRWIITDLTSLIQFSFM